MGGQTELLAATSAPSRKCAACLVFLILISAASFPAAEQNDINIEVAVGFSSTIPVAPPGRCTPLRVVLTNEANPFHGELLARQKGSPHSYSVPVDLPSESRLAYHLTFFPKPDPDYSRGEDLLEVRLLDHQGRNAQTEVAPLQFPQERDRVLAVFGTPGRPYGGLGFRPPEEDSDTPARLVIPGGANLLPEDVLEYEAIWAVIWDGQDWSSLTETQCDALLQFVDIGGTLVIGAGSFWQGIMRTPIAPHLPLAYEGASPVGSTSGWEKLGVTTPMIPGNLVGAFGPLVKEAEVLATAEGRPLIVRSRYGGGRIIQFGIPFGSVWWARWDDWSRFSQMIFREGGLPDRRYASQAVLAELFRQQATFQIRLPSHWQVAGVLLVHLLLAVVGGYFLFRRKDLLLAWGLFAVLAGVFGGSIYAVGSYLFAKQARVRTVSWLHARGGSGYAVADTGMVLYSPRTIGYSLRFPEKGAFPVGLSGPQFPDYPPPQVWSPMVSPRRSRQRWFRTFGWPTRAQYRMRPYPSGGGGVHVRFEQDSVIQDLLVQQWSTRVIRVVHVVDLQGRIDGELLAEGDEYRLRLENNSVCDLGKTFVMSAWGHREVADIRTGRLVSSSNQAMRPTQVFHGLGWLLDARYIDPSLQSSVVQWGEWPWSEYPDRGLLLSRLETPLIPCEISPDAKTGESTRLAAVELPVSLTGETIDLPPLSWKWSVEEGDAYSAREDVAQEFRWWDLPQLATLDMVQLAGAEVMFRFRPAIDLRGWEIEHLRVSFPALQRVGPSRETQSPFPGGWRGPVPFLIEPVKKLSLRAYDFHRNVWTPVQFSEAGTCLLSDQFVHPLYREVVLKIKARNEEAQDKPFSLNLKADIRRKEAT